MDNIDDDPIKKIGNFITDSNCFEVMGQFRKLGILTKEDIKKAMTMESRSAWLDFMKEKAGIAKPENKTELEKNIE